jgi:hypothetical protein
MINEQADDMTDEGRQEEDDASTWANPNWADGFLEGGRTWRKEVCADKGRSQHDQKSS